MTAVHPLVRPTGVRVAACRANSPRGIVKAYVLAAEGDVVLIDCGFEPADLEIITDAVARAGHALGDLAACLLTHSHRDHVGALATLRAAVDVPVLAHTLEAERVAEVSGIAVDQTVEHDQLLPWCRGIRVIHVPGHTPGSVALYSDAERALFVGDAIFSGGCHLMPSPPYLAGDPGQANESAKALASLPWAVDHVFPAHGEPVYGIGDRNLKRLLMTKREF
jgi:glyoxylase-like metal-dependent hydrolase (beta-lactamase superfamily II)